MRAKLEVSDILAVIGLGILSYGAWLVYQPAAFILAGALIIMAAIGMARR
ncbi:hypothetical protein JNB91_23840 [Rhizobium wenxiniae]|nr:hypothetical protein [Rhizobium wenxiniae]MBW9090848.1 hypothetical protein [Rhizobium wenxiniae]